MEVDGLYAIAIKRGSPAVHWMMVVCRFMRVDLHMASSEDVYVERLADALNCEWMANHLWNLNYMLNSVGMVL